MAFAEPNSEPFLKHGESMEEKQILIVDDEQNTRFSIDFTLSSAGFLTEQACNGTEALEKLKGKAEANNPFHLVIADIQMPDMNGIQLIDAIRQAGITVPVMVITGFGDKQTLVELVRRRCDYYLDKPFSPQELLTAVGTVLCRVEQTGCRCANLHQEMLVSEKLNMIGQLAPKIAHEINNPAQVIQGYAEMLMSSAKIDDESKALLANIREAVQIIVKLNRSLMDLSRPLSINLSTFRPEMPLDKAIDFLTKAGVIKHCTVQRHYDSTAPAITGDSMQLYQVFLNLILNAAYAMQNVEKKILTVTLKQDPGTSTVSFSITDTGCGIAPENIDKIFIPFFTTHPANGGTGLGLAVVKQVVENHGGTIQVTSRPGEGATFQITLPTNSGEKGGYV